MDSSSKEDTHQPASASTSEPPASAFTSEQPDYTTLRVKTGLLRRSLESAAPSAPLPGAPHSGHHHTSHTSHIKSVSPHPQSLLHPHPHPHPQLHPHLGCHKRRSVDHFSGIAIPRGGWSLSGTSPTDARSISVDRGHGSIKGLGLIELPTPRHKNHHIPLLLDPIHYIAEEDEAGYESEVDGTYDELGEDDRVLASVAKRGRVTVFNIMESFCREAVEGLLKEAYPGCESKMSPEVIYLQTPFAAKGAFGDVFIFDYGVVACWGLTPEQEQSVLQQLQDTCDNGPSFLDEEILSANFSFHYSRRQQPNIQNDTITINLKQAQDYSVKLAITHALSQSSKLSLYEYRITMLAEEVRFIPEHLACYGEIQLPRKQVSKLMGRVFLQKSAVNLLSTVLDTPEFFWRMPDSLQLMYDSVIKYLELRERVELINGKFIIIQKILKVWSIHSCHTYLSKLDTIILWLIFLEVLLTLFQVAVLLFPTIENHKPVHPMGLPFPPAPGWSQDL